MMVFVVVTLATLLAVALAGIVVLVDRNRAAEVAVVAAESDPPPDEYVAAVAESARLAAALDALSVGVVVADAKGEVSYENRAASLILSSRDSLSIVNRAVRELLSRATLGETNQREIDLFGPPKATYLLRASPLVGLAGGPSGVAVVQDITERRRTDEVRRDFVSNISHELKTPVGAVGLLAETLRDETDMETIGRFSGRISLEITRLSRTIDDLLELSRIEFGDDLEIADVEVRAALGEAVGRFQSATEPRGLTLDMDCDDGVYLRGDRRQITSAVCNLIDNAVKYSHDGAAIKVRATRDDRSVSISVTDEGDGIPSRDLGRVFERFYRVDRARSRETGGTGLGLAIVRHVVQNHGGDVAVTSREGYGSTFTLKLPVGGPPRRLSQEPTDTGTNPGSVHVDVGS